ncbi:uncharacterized protein LOC113373739 [Ctenocephalides felis]|uniref:uncharacterized protein LOC113373739 n=1 Tax=Ctenocephalides felis TaxID=7515 RepID=UPI000E6E3EF6|nr:uncharacterized protein LOC113373739 [Ctenocephalides felis]
MANFPEGFIAPDGGWGWMVVIAFAVANMIIVPLIRGFTLIYKRHICCHWNVNNKRISIGFSLALASYSLALNTYFKKRRHRAAGIAMTITGIGPIFVPHMITYFVQNYGALGCMLIFGAIATHTFATALLLQPVKWHMKKHDSSQKIKDFPKDIKQDTLKNCEKKQKLCSVVITKEENSKEVNSEPKMVDSIWDVFLSEEEHEYLEKKKNKAPITRATMDGELQIGDQSLHPSLSAISKEKSHSVTLTKLTSLLESQPDMVQRKYASQPIIYNEDIKNYDDREKSHRISVVMDYLGDDKLNTYNEYDDRNETETSKLTGENKIQTICMENGTAIVSKDQLKNSDKTTCCEQFTEKVVQFFDLKLLADPTYIVIMIGISTSIFSEMNFSMLTPFILGDMGLTRHEIAYVMSVIAISDIITRFICPFIGDYFKQTPRMMFIHSLVILILTRTGIGPIFVPHMITYFVQNYGALGCMLIFGAIATHTFATALLLQPVKWHMKKDDSSQKIKDFPKDIKQDTLKNCEEKQKLCSVVITKEDNSKEVNSEPKMVDSIWDVFLSEEEHEYLEKKKNKAPITRATMDGELQIGDQSLHPSLSAISKEKSHSVTLTKLTSLLECQPDMVQRKYASQPIIYNEDMKNYDEREKSHRISVVMDYLGNDKLNTFNEYDDRNETETSKLTGENKIQTICMENGTAIVSKDHLKNSDKTTCCEQFTEKVVQFFDLKLLADPTYIVIMIGISTSIFSEMNFSMLTPFILGDMGLTRHEIAYVMSVIAISDIVTRFICPFIGDYFKQTPRMMFIHSLVILILTRTGLIYCDTYYEILLCALGLGISKGIRVVYTGLIIPGYVSLERLPCALGLQNVSNGIFVLAFGPLLGVIRDYSGSYTKVLIFLNTAVLLIIVIWGIESQWKASRTKKLSKNDIVIHE